jgi:hypothetical protein
MAHLNAYLKLEALTTALFEWNPSSALHACAHPGALAFPTGREPRHDARLHTGLERTNVYEMRFYLSRAGCAKSTALHACAHHGASPFPTGTRSTSRAGCAKSTTRPSRAFSTRNRRADRRPAVGTCARPEDPSVCAPRGFAPRLTKDSSASGSSIGARPDEP